MSFSRIDKLVATQGKLTTLAAAQAARDREFHLILPARSTPAVALMARSAIALALRSLKGPLCVSIDSIVDHGGHKGLLECLEEEAASYGQSERLKIGKRPAPGALELGVGIGREGAVVADASGWNCAVNRILPPLQETAAPAATMAAAMAFAKLFATHVLGQDINLRESWELSLETHLPNRSDGIVRELDIGDGAILGGGAIGSAAIFILKHSGWKASLDLIDFDRYDSPNEETTMLVGIPEIRRNRLKAIALSEIGSTNNLKITPIVYRLEDAADKHLLKRRDIFLAAVDNAQARRLLDSVNASVLLNAAVGGSPAEAGHVLWTRHRGQDKALSGFYPPTEAEEQGNTMSLPKEIEDECSRIAYRNASFAAPFIALAAGSLLIAGCAHNAMGVWSDPNYLKFDLFGCQSKFRRQGPY